MWSKLHGIILNTPQSFPLPTKITRVLVLCRARPAFFVDTANHKTKIGGSLRSGRDTSFWRCNKYEGNAFTLVPKEIVECIHVVDKKFGDK